MKEKKNSTGKAVKQIDPIRKLQVIEIVPDNEFKQVIESIEQQGEIDNWNVKVLALTDALEKIQEEYGVNIGLQLDTAKIMAINNHMIKNGCTTVNIKFEIWK